MLCVTNMPIMLSLILLSVVILNVITLSVEAPLYDTLDLKCKTRSGFQ
jgi:hypothetical protein